MANNNRKFTLSLEIDSKTAEQQIKTTAKNINKILEGMGNASDKMTYFKELADYIGQIDQQLGAFRKTHGEDMFNKMFGGLDSGLQKQMQSLFDTTKKELSAVEELQQKIASARKNGASKDEAKALKSEVEALYKNLGRSDEISISNRLGPAKMLEEAENALNGFAAKWKDVNNKIASGFNFGGSGSSANIQNKINELNEAKNSLQKTLDGIKNNKIGDIELPKGDKKQLEFLKKLVSEYKAAKIAKEDFEKRKDTGSDGYAKAMATYVDSAKKLKGAFDSDPDGEKFGNKSFDYMTKELDTYEDAERGLNNFYNNQKTILTKIKALYSSEIQGINNEIDKLSAGPKNQSSTYDELYSKLKKYLDLQKQLDDENISDADYDKASNDINNIEKEIAALGELKGKAKDVKDVFASFNQGEIADNDLFDKLKNTLGIEIPQNAEKAENALKELDNASEKFSDNIADIKKEADAHEENTAAIRQEEAAQEALNQEKKESKTYIDNTAEEAKESAAAIKEAERAQEMLNQEKKEAQDIKTSEEIAQLEKLEAKIKEVTAAVEVKTKAFKEEGDIVGNVVRQEIMALDTLSTYLDSIYVVINSIVDGLNKVNNTKLNSSDMNVSGKSTSKDYALESTLQRANDILGKILTAVSSDESTGQILKALDSAIMELKEAANAIKTNANNMKQDSTDSVKDTSDSSKKNEKTFDQLKNDEISSFEKYKKDVESSVHITDEFKGKLEKLQAELKNTNDVSSLDAWKQSFSALQSEFSRFENASKNVLTGQINSIKKEAKDAMKGLDFDLPTDDSVKRAKLEEIKQGFKEIQIESDICADKVKNNQNVEIAALNKTKQQLLENINAYKKQYGLLNSGGKSGKNYGSTAVIRETTRYNQFQQYADDADMGFKNSSVFNGKLQEYTNAYNKLIAIREKLSSKPVLTDRDVQEFNDAKQAAANYGKELDKMIAKSNKLASNKFKSDVIGSDINVNDALSRKQALTDFVTGMHDARESTIKFSNDYQECTFKMKNSDGTWTKMSAVLDKTSNKMYSTAGEVTKYGTAFGEFIGSLKGEFLKLGRYMAASFGIQEVIQAVRKGVTYVKQIDDALTDLKKVTNETDAGYDRFLQTMSKTAGVVGSTVAELTTMAAEWARLGYSMQEAANLAESTAVLLNVSEFEDATAASEALISTIQAFGYAADDSMHVVDILNEVGNNFAISSDGIATALQDSASALMAGGNSMEEATAMIAAANKVVQDPSQVGSGLRTISLRLRGTSVSGELEELGEDTEGLVSASKMRDKIMGLAGVDILTDTGAYKSTYEIIKEIGHVWEDMSDIDQAALLELMAGKNRSNIMAALLTNMKDLEGAYESAMDAEGSAYRENEAYLDSIQGRVDLFMNALQTFWMNFISSDMIKGIVDLGTTLIQFLDTSYGKVTALGVAFAGFLKITKNVDTFKNALNSVLGTNFKASRIGSAANMASSGAASAKVFMSEFSKGINKNPTGMGISKAISANIKDPNTRINIRNAVTSALGVKNISEVGELTKAQQKQAASAMQAAAASSKLGTAQTMTTMATAGLTSASNMAKTAFSGLKNVVVAHPFMAIAAAVLVAVAAIDKFTISAKEASEASHDKFNEISDVYSTTKSNISDMEGELSTINSQIAELEGKNLSFTDAQELERLKAQRSELENNLSIQEQLLEAQEKVKNEAAVAAMKDFVKASNEGAESASKTGKAIGLVTGAAIALGVALAPFTGGTSLLASVATATGASSLTLGAAVAAGGAAIGYTAGDVAASNMNAATVNSYEDWYKTYTEAYKKKSRAAADARKKYEKDPGDMDKYDEWQELEQEAMDVQSKMYDNLTQMQNYYSDIEYGQSEALDRELDTWYNFLDKMNIDQNGAVAKVNALDRIFGENASDEIKKFKKEIDKVIKNSDDEFDIAAEIEGRDELQGLEDQLAEIGITTDEVSDYFRQTGEIGTTAFSDLSGEIKEAKDAVTKLQAALDNNTNQGYETRNTAIEEMKHLMEEGIIGSESNLWNIAEAMGFTYDSAKSIEENADALYDYIEARDAWYEVDEDGEWGTAGADAFAKDIENAVKNSKKLQELKVKWDFNESTGELNFDFNNMKFDEIVAALGETKEAAGLTNEEFIDMLTHLGQFYDVQWTSGNDVVSYLEYLGTTSLSVKEQLEAVEEPLRQLMSKKGIESKDIEDYLTGNGSLKKLPEDLQNAIGAYRNLREEVEKPIDTTNVVKSTGTEEKGGFFSKVREFFSGDKSKEKVEQQVDVEVKANEVDATDVQEKTKKEVEKAESVEDATFDKTVDLEVRMEDLINEFQKVEDKDVTIDVKVKGLNDVEKLNKNLDLDSKVKGNVNKLSEYVKDAKALSKLDDNITSEVTAEVYGNVIDEPEYKLNNLEVFAESAKNIKDVKGDFSSRIIANVNGNVFSSLEATINNIKTYIESAKGIKDVEGNFSSRIVANVEGNVFSSLESTINNIEEYINSAKGIENLNDTFESKIIANVEGNVFSTLESTINNIKAYIDNAKGIEDLDNTFESKIIADVEGNVFTSLESTIDNIKTYIDSVQGIRDFEDVIESKIIANVEGNVFDTLEVTIDNIAKYISSIQGIKEFEGTFESKVIANAEGNVFDTFEITIDNIKKYIDSIQGIENFNNTFESKIIADVEGNVFDTLEVTIDNIKEYIESAKGIEDLDNTFKSKIVAEIEGNVFDTFEVTIDNIRKYIDSAQGITDLDDTFESKIIADVDGNVFDTLEVTIDNIAKYISSAQGIKELKGTTESKIIADVDGNVFDTLEMTINNLKTYIDSARGIKELKGIIESKIIADVDGNVFDTFEITLDNLKEYISSAKGIKGLKGEIESKITAEIDGNVFTSLESTINNVRTYISSAKGIKELVGTIESTVNANVEGNVFENSESKLNILAEFKGLIEGMVGQTVDVSVLASVDSESINNAIGLLTSVRDSGVFKDYNANVNVTANDEQARAVFQDVNNTILEDKIVDISEEGSSAVLSALDSINRKTLNSKTVKVNYVTGTMPSIPNYPGGRDGDSSTPWPLVDGTAHTNGTAYAGGNWGAPRTETALTGELGPELLVRNGRWTTIGENGAEFTEIKKGDIIFNHKQTEELLKNGYVTSGGGRGKAYAEGTAYAGGGGKRRVYTFTDDSVKKKNKKNNSSNSKSKKNSKDTTEEFEEVFDWFEVKIEEINEDLDLMAAKLENAITIKGKNNILDDMIKTNKSELTTLEKGYKLYNSYANDLIKEIPKKYREEAKNGKIAIEEFYGEVDEGTLEAIKNYREWAQKAADLKVQIQETKREIAELAKQKFDNISEKYDNIEGLQDNRQQHYVDMAELREDKGKINSGKYYKAVMKEEEKQKKSKQNEKKKLQASLDNAVKKGQIKKYSQEWYDMVNDIHAVDAEIDECTANIENYQNEINNIHFDNFEKKMSRTQYVADDLQNLINLVDNLGESFDESGNWTDEGITKMGLYAQSMEVAQVQSQEYADEIAYLKNNWKSMGMSYDEYQEKLAELNGKQQDAIDVYHDSKDAILEMQKARVDAIKNGIDEEIEAYEELIDKKKEELDAEKDLHDFQKNVMDQQEDIADIQRKLAALAGDNSAAAMAKRRQLEAELTESKQGLEDTYYDRSIENKQTALDKQLEAFTKAKEEEKEMWDEWLKNPEVVLKDGIDTVEGSGDTVKTVLGQTMDEFGISIRDSIMKPWNDSGTALDTTASKVQAIVTAFENAATAADTYAQKQINNQKEDNQDITARGQRGKNNSGNPLKGVKVTAEKGTQLYDKNGNKIKETTGKGKNKKTVDKKVKKETEYTAGKTNSKGMTALLNSKGQVVGYAKASDLDEKFKKGMTINADGAQLYDSADDKKGEAQNLETYTVLAVDNKVKRVKAKSTKKNSQGKYVTGWFDMSQVTITKLAKKKEQNSNGNTGKNNTGKNNTGKNNTGNNKNNNTKKAPKKGDSVTVDKSAKNYGSKSNNLKIPDFVKGGTYTVMQTSGSGDKMQVLIGKKGTPTGWVKLKDLKGYAKGSKSINKDQLALLDELGEELQIVPNSQGRLDYVKKGTGIIPADMTERLMNLAMNPQDMLDRNRPTIGVSPEIHNTEINLNMQYGDMLRIENFNGDSPEDVAKIVARQFEKHTAQLNQSLRKYVR